MLFTKSSVLLFILILILSVALPAQQQWDVREQDTIIVGNIDISSLPWPDSIALPIYIWADDTIGGLSLAFQPSDDRLEVSSFSYDGSIFDTIGTAWTQIIIDEVNNIIGFGWTNMHANWEPNPQGLIGTLYLKPDPLIPTGSEIDIDSAFLAPAIYFEMTIVVAGFSHTVRPAHFTNHGGSNVIFDAAFVCGDADASGAVDISDAVYLISYIFDRHQFH